jgi:hypothetical protein
LISLVGCGRDLVAIDPSRLVLTPMNENGLFEPLGGITTIKRLSGNHLPFSA